MRSKSVMRHIYDAMIDGEKFTPSARNMREAHRAVMREVNKRAKDTMATTTVSVVRRGSTYPRHTETI